MNGVGMDLARMSQSSRLALPQSFSAPPAQTAEAARDAQLDPKLVTAAHEFEATMMAELLKPLNSGGGFGGDDEESTPGAGSLGDLASSADGSGGALMSFSSEALAKALSDKGGFGIARRILSHFEDHVETALSGKSPGSAPGSGTDRGRKTRR